MFTVLPCESARESAGVGQERTLSRLEGYLWPRRSAVGEEAYERWLAMVRGRYRSGGVRFGSAEPVGAPPVSVIGTTFGDLLARGVLNQGARARLDDIPRTLARLDLMARLRGGGSDELQLSHLRLELAEFRSWIANMASTDDGRQRLATVLTEPPACDWYSQERTERGHLEQTLTGYAYRSWEADGSLTRLAELARIQVTRLREELQVSRVVLWEEVQPGAVLS